MDYTLRLIKIVGPIDWIGPSFFIKPSGLSTRIYKKSWTYRRTYRFYRSNFLYKSEWIFFPSFSHLFLSFFFFHFFLFPFFLFPFFCFFLCFSFFVSLKSIGLLQAFKLALVTAGNLYVRLLSYRSEWFNHPNHPESEAL